jgi:hypothetical protein
MRSANCNNVIFEVLARMSTPSDLVDTRQCKTDDSRSKHKCTWILETRARLVFAGRATTFWRAHRDSSREPQLSHRRSPGLSARMTWPWQTGPAIYRVHPVIIATPFTKQFCYPWYQSYRTHRWVLEDLPSVRIVSLHSQINQHASQKFLIPL